MESNLELLKKSVLFKGCSEEEIKLVSRLFKERLIKSNTIIFTEKTPAEALYLIKSGNVMISMMAGGEEQQLLLLGPGEFFGELALLQEESRMVTARSETAAELLMITRKEFKALMEIEPGIALRMVIAIANLLAMRVKAYGGRLRDMLFV